MSTTPLQARTVAPGLTTNDLERSIRFYVEGLGFAITQRNETDGKLRFVMLKGGGAELGLGQDDFAKGRDRKKGVGMRLWITTSQDVKVLAEQLKRVGFPLDSEVAPLPWGPLGFSVTDPDGFMLTVSNERE